MRILMISDVYFPRVNGVSTSIKTFKNELEKLGHTIHLIAPSYGDTTDSENNIIRIPSRYIAIDPEDRMMKFKSITQLADQLKNEQYDILHIHTPFIAHYAGIKLAKTLNTPVVETYHTFFQEYLYHYVPLLPKPIAKFAARWFSRSQCNSVDAVVVPSSAMHNALLNYGVKKPLHILPTGIELDKLKNGDGPAFRQNYNIPADRPVLVHVGRAAHEKNIDFLLETLAIIKKSIPEVLLIIAGEGPALSHLKKLTQQLQLNDNVLFVGYLARESKLLDCYNAGNAFIFASNTETQGLVLLEAMALGTPVVSTAVMGTKDVLKDGEGAIIAQEEVNDFANKVITLLQDQQQQALLSNKARDYAKTWSADVLAARMAELYSSLI